MSLGTSLSLVTDRVVEPVQGMHRAISEPWFYALAPLANVVRVSHGLISDTVYSSVRVGAAAAGAALDAAIGPDHPLDVPSQAIVNGLWGDDLGRRAGRLETSMTVLDRTGSEVSGPDLAAAFPDATDRVVVLVHGLAQTEHCWTGPPEGHGLAQALDRSPSVTAVALRYNTGLPIASNGAELASLLEQLCAEWPVPIRSMGLVGHSMGGLVTREARAVAVSRRHSWIEKVTDVVTIGSPHDGAPVARFVGAAAWALRIARQTRPLAGFLDRRSQGIKDLGSTGGTTTDEGGPHPLGPPDIRDHFIAGVVTANPAHPIGVLVGDLMVTSRGPEAGSSLEPTNVEVLGGVHHFGLLHEPAVIELVTRWVSAPTDRAVRSR